MNKTSLLPAFGAFLLLCCLFLGMTGCKVVQKIDSLNGILEEGPPPPEAGKLQQAEYAFYEGNYALARKIFSRVESTASQPLFRNHAVYGLACVAIATADTGKELQEALSILQGWKEPETDVDGFAENPKMIAAALNETMENMQWETEIRYVADKQESERAQSQQQEIAELKETIRKLEHQISIFEAIDQEIQEKRKPI